MSFKRYKATTPGRRFGGVLVRDITKKRPEKKLTSFLQKKAGRGGSGHISVRHRGGGAKRLYRFVDFQRQRYDEVATVLAIESAGGTEYEVRNRVTLCRCGRSRNKPFCDGSHITVGIKIEH